MSGVKVSRFAGAWGVICSRCPELGQLMWLKPILRAVPEAWDQAMWWAIWHAAEHDRTRCECCGRDRDVPPLMILDARTVKVGERLFVSDPEVGWREVAS